jgi:tetratricopeptide (TPR) repeat protein
MVCPYCGTRNTPTAVVCGQCGAILRDSLTIKAKSQKKAAQPVVIRKHVGSIVILCIGVILAFFVGDFLGKIRFESDRELQLACGGVAAMASAIILLVVSFGRLTILRMIYRSNRKKICAKLDELLTKSREAVEKELEDHNTAVGRFKLASIYLLANDVEKSIHQFEQAQQLSPPTRSEDLNNLSVALAQRGQLGPAFERLDKAISLSPTRIEPRFNMARILNQTGREVDSKVVEARLNEAPTVLQTSSDLLNQLGLSLAIQERTEAAIKIFAKAVSVSDKPKDRDLIANMRNNIGVAHAMAGRPVDAQLELNGILQTEPENARAAANLAVLMIGNRRYVDAVERLSQSLHLEPELAAAHCDLGYAYCQQGSINEGIREFRAAVLMEPNLFEAQYNLGKAYLDEGVLDYAERCLMRAIQLRRTSWQVHVALGVLYYISGLIDKAITCFSESLKLSPYEAVTLSALGACYIQKGNVDEAIVQFEVGLANNPHNAEILTNLSWAYILAEELNEGSDMAKRAIIESATLPQAYNNLGLCQITLGAPEVALDAFKKALALDSSLTKIYYHLGNTHIAMKQVENALKSWIEAAQAEPGNADVYTNLGVALYRQVKIEDAILEFRRVLKVRSDRKEDYINLGLALAAAKHHKEAIENFDKALAMDPRNAVVHSNRGLACYFANNVEEAMREWQMVTQLDPAYAKRRGKKQESEYDDAIIEYIPLYVTERAFFCKPHTAEFLYRFLPGYETDKWLVVAPCPELEPIAALRTQFAKFNRQLRALDMQ